jgi:hypothetical protein
MPFDDSFDQKFKKINKITSTTTLDEARRVKEGIGTAVITDEILDGIANSKTLLFDLSKDPKYEKKCPNPNVMYELGIAMAMREPEDILIIVDSSEEIKELPFDIQSIRIHKHSFEIDENLFKEELEKVLKNQKWHKSKRVKSAAESIDEMGLGLMLDFGIIPKEIGGWFSFDKDNPLSIPRRMAAHRLMDLGILWFDTGKDRNPSEYAYHWTSFGYEVMKHLGISRTTVEEFMRDKPEKYNAIIQANKEWAESHKGK